MSKVKNATEPLPEPLASAERQFAANRRSAILFKVLGRCIAVLMIFMLGVLAARIGAPQSAEAVVLSAKTDSSFYLPVNSCQLTVTLVPLQPSAKIEAQLALSKSKALSTARELTSEAGLKSLGADLQRLYPFSFEVGAPLEVPDDCYDFDRQQYDTSEVLDWFKTRVSPGSFKNIGLLYSDVYDEGMNFLFGQARITGPVCVVSASRMGQDLEGAKLSAQQRFFSIVRHELGHTLGLQHVKDKHSVMAFGNSLPELDRQGTALTREDWKRLKELHPIRWGE